MSRIRGPNAFMLEADGSIEVSVGCRDCGWAAVKEKVPEDKVHAVMDSAKLAFAAHDCRPRST